MTAQELYVRAVALRKEVNALIEAATNMPPTIELCVLAGKLSAISDVLYVVKMAGVPDDKAHPLDGSIVIERPDFKAISLSDDEIRQLTLWETDEEIPAFKLGWCYRRRYGRVADGQQEPDAKMLAGEPQEYVPSTDWGQNERVAWGRGWNAADAVYRRLTKY